MRDPLDRSYTPADLAQDVVERLDVEPVKREWLRIFEPSVGGGAFVRAARERWGASTYVVGVDIDPSAAGLGECQEHTTGSLMDVALPPADRIDLCLGNPPFMHAEGHTTRILEQEYPVTALILPLGFLASQERVRFWQRFPPLRVGLITERPSFTQDGATDMRDVALFEWHAPYARHAMQGLHWIAHLTSPRGLDSIRWRT